jgi:hypothetical protein
MKAEDLKVGEIALLSAKKVNGGKIQLEFAQKIKMEGKSQSIVSLLNKSDDRFIQTDKPRYAWMSGEQKDIEATFGIKLNLVEVGDTQELAMLNPTIEGQPLNIRIIETTKGTEYDVANFETRAKRAGKDGEFITTPGGEYIYTKTDVVVGTANHVLIKETTRENAAKSAIDSALGA